MSKKEKESEGAGRDWVLDNKVFSLNLLALRVQKYESTKTDSRRSRCEGLGVGQTDLSTQFICFTSATVQKLTRGAEAARGTGARQGLGVEQDAAARLASEPSGFSTSVYTHVHCILCVLIHLHMCFRST